MPTDQQLEDAFAAHHPYLLRYCLRRVGDLATAEDLVGQVWLLAVRHRAVAIDGAGAMRAWLTRVARSRCIDHARALTTRATVPLPEHERAAWAAPWAATPFEDGVLRTMDTTARDVLAALPPPSRELLMRRYLGGETPEQIAAQMGVSRVCVRSRIHRALLAARRVAGEVRGD